MSTYTGAYVNHLVMVLTASAISGEHAVVFSPPGWGKTSIARDTAARIGKFVLVRIDPTTPPEAIRGAYNPAALLQGRLERVLDGTPYEDGVRVAILDELFRADDVFFDACLALMDRVGWGVERPVVWATSNFVAQSERVNALIDRIALWYWVKPDGVDVRQIAIAHVSGAGPQLPNVTIPDWSQIVEVRKAMATVTRRSSDVVADFLESIASEAVAQGLALNPRRVAQWTSLITALSIWEHGTADFDSVGGMARRAMLYAWAATSPSDADAWKQVVMAVSDRVGAAIESVLSEALKKFREVSSLPTAQERLARAGELGQVIASAQMTLRGIAQDARIEAAIATLNEWFSQAIQGVSPKV